MYTETQGGLWAGGRERGEVFVAEIYFYCGSHQGKLRRHKKYRKTGWDCGLAQGTLICSRTIRNRRNGGHRNAFTPHATEEKSTLHYTKQSCCVVGVFDEETRQTSVSTRVERSRGSSVTAQHLAVCAAWLHSSFPIKRGQAERGSSRCGSKWPWRKKQHCGLLQPGEVWKYA